MNKVKSAVNSLKQGGCLTETISAVFLGMLILIQRFLTGVYKPVMDDWFLYGDLYRKLFGRLKYFAVPNEKFAIRPMAGFFDCFVNAPLFEHLWAAELILTLSLLIGAFLIIRTMRKNGCAGIGFFLCLVCLFPVGLEATYWIAAATRVCYSMLFIGGAVYSLDTYCKTHRKCALWFFAALGMLAVCFYEPAIVIYLLLTLFVIFNNRGEKRGFIPLIITACQIAVIGIYYIVNSASGEIEARGGLLSGNVIEHTKQVFTYTKRIFGSYTRALTAHGFKNGLSIILGGHWLIKTSVITVLSLLFGISASLCVKKRKFSLKLLVFAVILTAGGLVLNFVLGSDRIPLRLVYFSYLGIGLFADELLMLLPRRINCVLTAVLLTGVSFVFTVSGIGEVRDYQTVSDFDRHITQQILDLDTEGNVTNIDKNTYVFGGQHCYEETKCIHYLDHIRGTSGNYADFTGCMQHLAGKAWTNNLVPFTYGDIQILKPYIDEDGLCTFYNIEYDKTVVRADIVPDGENYKAVREDGSVIGTLVKVDDTRYQYFD